MFSPSNYTFGIPDIDKHIHVNLKVPETVEMQLRLKRKWEANSSELHNNTLKEHSVVEMSQLRKIAFMVDYAFSTHPFYNKLYSSVGYKRGDIVSWDDYNALPTISKKDILENYDLFAKANLSPKIEDCYISRTSGSSGQVLNIIEDLTMVDFHMQFFYRFHEQILGRKRMPNEWLYDIYLVTPPYSSLNGDFPTFTVSNNCPIEAVYEHLKLIKPTILNGFPSYLERLSTLITDPSELNIKAITTNSETSTPAQRKKIAEKFQAKVFDEYSSVELSLIATQCAYENYHIVEDNVRVDVINPDKDGFGEIVVTNINNSFMPFIRYRQGDIIKINDHRKYCACGNKFRTLQSFMGRIDQFLYSKTIGKVPPDLIMALYDNTLIERISNIDEFQIVQKSFDEILVRVVLFDKATNINQDVFQRFCSELQDIFHDSDLKIVLEVLDKMPPEKSHKRRLIKCEIPQELLN